MQTQQIRCEFESISASMQQPGCPSSLGHPDSFLHFSIADLEGDAYYSTWVLVSMDRGLLRPESKCVTMFAHTNMPTTYCGLHEGYWNFWPWPVCHIMMIFTWWMPTSTIHKSRCVWLALSKPKTRSISRICCLICLTDSPTNTPNNFDQWLMIKVLKVMLSEHVVDGYG